MIQRTNCNLVLCGPMLRRLWRIYRRGGDVRTLCRQRTDNPIPFRMKDYGEKKRRIRRPHPYVEKLEERVRPVQATEHTSRPCCMVHSLDMQLRDCQAADQTQQSRRRAPKKSPSRTPAPRSSHRQGSSTTALGATSVPNSSPGVYNRPPLSRSTSNSSSTRTTRSDPRMRIYSDCSLSFNALESAASQWSTTSSSSMSSSVGAPASYTAPPSPRSQMIQMIMSPNQPGYDTTHGYGQGSFSGAPNQWSESRMHTQLNPHFMALNHSPFPEFEALAPPAPQVPPVRNYAATGNPIYYTQYHPQSIGYTPALQEMDLDLEQNALFRQTGYPNHTFSEASGMPMLDYQPINNYPSSAPRRGEHYCNSPY